MKLSNGIKSKKTFWLFALLCAAMWGSATIYIKFAYGAFGIAASDTASQLLMIGLRFLFAGVISEIVFSLGAGRLLYPQNRAACGHVTVLSFAQVIVLYPFLTMGVANASGTMVSMINGTSTFFAILFATFVFRSEKMTFRKALACVLGFGAIVLMNYNGQKLTFTLKGEGAMLLAMLLAGLSHNITKQFSATDDPAMLSAWQNFFGGLVLTLAGLLMGGRLEPSLTGWAVLMYLALVSGVAFGIWGLLMKQHGVSTINVFQLANPLFGVLFSVILLGEAEQAFSFKTLIAFLLIAAGIVLVNLPEKKDAGR